ncbi:universal stress protein [Desulfovibrio sp. OttesenSCG-928-C14]|nr:universal stress protein [Desulfovibrio sp. OttesenSCG-928-C14]
MSFTKILFPVDNSDYSRKAIELVASLTCKDRGEVTLLHVVPPIPALIGNPMHTRLQEEMTAAAKEFLREFKAELEDEELDVKVMVRHGDAASEILEAAQEEGCEIIVMGARGLGSLAEMFLGSVSQKILQYSKIPVAIAR